MATSMKTVREILDLYGKRILQLMQRALASTDNLKKEIDYKIVESDGQLRLEFDIPEYGKYVDQGRRPWGKNVPSDQVWNAPHNKYPPAAPIEAWIKSKGLPQFRIQKQWKSAGNKGGRWISHASRLFLIRRSIAVRGIKPRPFLHYIDDNMESLYSEIGAAAAIDIAVNMQAEFNAAGIGENGEK